MRKYDKLTRLLDFMEHNIDLEFIREIEQLQYDAISYKEIDRIPLTVCTEPEGFEQVPLETAFDNPEMMLFNEILWSTNHSSYNSVRMKDDSPLMIRSNHGKGIIASMFGCKMSFCSNQMPKVGTISLDDAKKVFAKGVPNVRCGLGKKVIDTYMYFHERLESYPKCYRAIRITQPDIQSPFDILHLIIGSDALVLPYQNADLAKYMIDVITHTYINFTKEVDLLLTDKMNDAVFVNGLCCGGRVLIKANSASANLSQEMYELCETEPDSYIFDVFSAQGGGSICYCGESKSWQKAAMPYANLRCVNYTNSNMYSLQEEYEYYRQHNIAIVGWGANQPYDKVKAMLDVSDGGKPIKTGMTLMCSAESIDYGAETLKRHRGM